MKLEQFIRDTLIAIQKGCQQAETDQSEADIPVCDKEGTKGIEFDLAVDTHGNEITVSGYHSSGNVLSRLRFFVPIFNK